MDKYISYIKTVKRYSLRTVTGYEDVLREYFVYTHPEDIPYNDKTLSEDLTSVQVRNYEVWLMEMRKMSPVSVNHHLSVLSGFCRWLLAQNLLISNPVKVVKRPKVSHRLPEFYKEDSMNEYFQQTEWCAGEDMEVPYSDRLGRAIVSTLYSTGIRRSELINLKLSDLDCSRKVIRIAGKGDKIREIPLVDVLYQEILLYLHAVEGLVGGARTADSPLFVRPNGDPLYPVFVDRVVKKELLLVKGITGRRSPHVLRHTLATSLLDSGSDLNSIKELLGHSSLAATQVYTHNSISRLKKVYQTAHPRAKNGGKHGD